MEEMKDTMMFRPPAARALLPSTVVSEPLKPVEPIQPVQAVQTPLPSLEPVVQIPIVPFPMVGEQASALHGGGGGRSRMSSRSFPMPNRTSRMLRRCRNSGSARRCENNKDVTPGPRVFAGRFALLSEHFRSAACRFPVRATYTD